MPPAFAVQVAAQLAFIIMTDSANTATGASRTVGFSRLSVAQ